MMIRAKWRRFADARQLLRCECGATAIEYALIASMLSIAIVAGVTSAGETVAGLFQSVVDGFEP